MMELDTIYNQDCLIGMRDIPDKAIDMILCDLPYGTTSNDWDKVIPIEPLWEQYNRIIKDNGAIVLTAQMPFAVDLVNGNRKMFRYEWIWHKTHPLGFLNSRKMPLRAHENILVFYKSQPTYNAQGTVRGSPITHGNNGDNFDGGTDYYFEFLQQKKGVNYGRRTVKLPDRFNSYEDMVREYSIHNWPRDVITFKNVQQEHPTAKPIELFEYLIRTYTNEGDIVLDNCMGGGTTAVSCMNCNRHYIGYELNRDYYEYSIKRVQAHTVTVNDRKKQKDLSEWL